MDLRRQSRRGPVLAGIRSWLLSVGHLYLPVARRGSYLGEQAISDRDNHIEGRF